MDNIKFLVIVIWLSDKLHNNIIISTKFEVDAINL